jgi:hypothetical protein
MPVTADDYWSSYELGTAKSLVEAVKLAKDAAAEDLENWAWRGQSDASWGLHGTLSRRLFDIDQKWPDEKRLVVAEQALFERAERWGLGWSPRGRLSALELLALMRHHQSPSRFIDVSTNLAVALHDACAPNGDTDTADARIFAFDGQGEVNTMDITILESGPLSGIPAWWDVQPEWWLRDYTIWKPPAIDDRIVRQQGAFLIGGVPTTAATQKWYLQGGGPNTGERYTGALKQAEVREVTSVGARCHSRVTGGRTPKHPVRNFRIAAKAKPSILIDIQRLFGLSPAGIYPDAAGFNEFGVREVFDVL